MPFPWTYLARQTTDTEKSRKIRGCSQRNEGLMWVVSQNITKGVLYFADDDNTYDLRLFDELRTTNKIGMLPVGNIPHTGLSSPIIKNGKVRGFLASDGNDRKWNVHISGFATNINFWIKRGRPFFTLQRQGYLETYFLESMNITLDDIEPKAQMCTQMLVWHTRTKKLSYKSGYNRSRFNGTNIPILMTLR